jgi:two-component system response regulator YesN
MFKLVSELYINTIKSIVISNNEKKQLETKEIHDYIEHHFCDNISLESIADQFFVTKEHLSRTYKAHYDMTINEQLIRYRMEKAKILIHDQKLAIKDVALIVGYADLAYFYRVFKKHVGMTPGDYRTGNNINNVQ